MNHFENLISLNKDKKGLRNEKKIHREKWKKNCRVGRWKLLIKSERRRKEITIRQMKENGIKYIEEKKQMKPNVLYRIFLLQCKNYLKKINK